VRANLCYANDLLGVNDLRHDSEVIAANIEDDQAFDIVSAIKGLFQVNQLSPLGGLNLFDPFSKWNSGISVLGDEFVDGSTVLDYHFSNPFRWIVSHFAIDARGKLSQNAKFNLPDVEFVRIRARSPIMTGIGQVTALDK